MGSTNDTSSDFNVRIEKWRARYEKQKQAGWVHSMCLNCFRKRWPHGKYSSWQTPVKFRQWEACCFCLQRHKDGIHKTRDPLNRELRCAGIHAAERPTKGKFCIIALQPVNIGCHVLQKLGAEEKARVARHGPGLGLCLVAGVRRKS